MGTATPKPHNFQALSNAWNNPLQFARELANYYSQLESSGHRTPAHHWTERNETR